MCSEWSSMDVSVTQTLRPSSSMREIGLYDFVVE